MLPTIDTNAILDALSMGEIDPIRVKIWMKEWEQALDRIKELADDMAYEEALKYGEKKFDKDGYTIEVCEYLAPRYDYTQCNHPLLTKYSLEAKQIDEKVKAVQKQLQLAREVTTILDEDTGELCTVMPAVKTGRSGIKLTKLKA